MGSGRLRVAASTVTEMSEEARLKWLRRVLVVTGVLFVCASSLLFLWPSGWRWEPNQTFYEEMIFGIYATLGVFLVLAARDPEANLSLIWFVVWSSLVHGAIMALQALTDPVHRGHLVGDVPALLLVAGLLVYLTPRRQRDAEQAPADALPED